MVWISAKHKVLDHHNINFSDWIIYTMFNLSENNFIRISAIIYYIWYARNISIYEDRIKPEEEIFQRAVTSIQDFQQAISASECMQSQNHLPASLSKNPRVTHWIKPLEGFFKANSNANIHSFGN